MRAKYAFKEQSADGWHLVIYGPLCTRVEGERYTTAVFVLSNIFLLQHLTFASTGNGLWLNMAAYRNPQKM